MEVRPVAGCRPPWLSTSSISAVLHGVIRTGQKRYRQVEAQLATVSVAAGERPDEVAELERLQQRIAFGWGVFDVIVLVVLWLMLFRPGR